MTLPEFLEGECAALPKSRPGNVDFPDYLSLIFTDFITGLQAVTGTDQLTSTVLQNVATVQSIADSIVQIVREYYAGSPGQAFDLLSQMLGQQSQHFGKLYTIPLKPEDLSNLYRLRVADAGEFGREQMFHIPFELRHKVATQRYSIPGFPSLYLGSSAYICWKELRCPQFDDVYSARLEAKSTVRVLNLGYRPRAVGWYARVQIQSGTNNQQLLEFLLAQVMFWPLLTAASVRVLHPDAPFKPEYIVPQLVLQFVREDRTNNID
jgi:hypothetical protein